MEEFRDTLTLNGLVDLKSMGENLTWWNSSIDHSIFRKLDRVVVNADWLQLFPCSNAHFLPRLLSDHSPAQTCLGIEWKKIGKPFQFFHHLLEHPEFFNIVKTCWSLNVSRDPWFILSSKLKHVKTELKKLNVVNGNLKVNVQAARQNLQNFQAGLTTNVSSSDLLLESPL